MHFEPTSFLSALAGTVSTKEQKKKILSFFMQLLHNYL
jgi:hypothetical protein